MVLGPVLIRAAIKEYRALRVPFTDNFGTPGHKRSAHMDIPGTGIVLLFRIQSLLCHAFKAGVAVAPVIDKADIVKKAVHFWIPFTYFSGKVINMGCVRP